MSVKVYHFIVTNCCWYAQMSSSTIFFSGSRRGRPPAAASTSADGRFTPVVSNSLKRSILVPSVRHWKYCATLFKLWGPYHCLGEGPPTMGRWTTFGENAPKMGDPVRQWHCGASNWCKRVPAMMPNSFVQWERAGGLQGGLFLHTLLFCLGKKPGRGGCT